MADILLLVITELPKLKLIEKRTQHNIYNEFYLIS